MKCFNIYCERARFRNAIGKFYLIFRSYYAETVQQAEDLYRRDIETNGPPLVAKEIPNPFDAENLENYSNNTSLSAQTVRRLVSHLRAEVDKVATVQARHEKEWHDDTEAEDHPLFQAPAEIKYPRAVRDAAILELVKTHLQVITDNEAAEAKRNARHE